MLQHLEVITGKTTKGKSWEQIVYEIIIGDLIFGHKSREIPDRYMFFITEHINEIQLKGAELTTELLTIALQRILHGAVLHPKDIFPDEINLSEENKKLLTMYYMDRKMSEGAYVFLMRWPIELSLHKKKTRKLALAILFGLLEWIEPNGNVSKDDYMLGEYKDKALTLYLRAQDLVERNATFEEIFYRYATRSQWEKHKMWFSENFKRIDWNAFFRDTHVLDGCNFIERAVRKKKIKEEIKKISLKKAM